MSGSEVLFVRSSKKNSKLDTDDTSTNDDDDVWDDTLLIKAYDKAVHVAHSEVLKSMSSSDVGKNCSVKGKKQMHWDIGDKCRCEYSEDHNYYEADVIDIIHDTGMCVVKYVGYENEEKVPLNKLKPSKGELYRNLQVKQALQENLQKDDASVGKEPEFSCQNQSQKKETRGKRTGKSKNKNYCFSANGNNFNSFQSFCPLSEGMNIPPPPPPPPHMFGHLSEDICESEAMSAMLMAWYMSGYHTGYYQGLKTVRKK